MTTIETAEHLDEVRALVARLDRLLATPSPTSVLPDGTPGPVAAGELIESAWGNAVVGTLKRDIGCSYTQGGQVFTSGQQTNVLWPTRNYDNGGLNSPNGANFTIPANSGGTWAFNCWMRSDPGAPTQNCVLYMNTSPAMTVQVQAQLMSGTRGTLVSWIGKANPGLVATFGFYNAHPGNLTFVAQMEARWLGF